MEVDVAGATVKVLRGTPRQEQAEEYAASERQDEA
jgi:hypothetical protein